MRKSRAAVLDDDFTNILSPIQKIKKINLSYSSPEICESYRFVLHVFQMLHKKPTESRTLKKLKINDLIEKFSKTESW